MLLIYSMSSIVEKKWDRNYRNRVLCFGSNDVEWWFNSLDKKVGSI
jgi:hypothetical protein